MKQSLYVLCCEINDGEYALYNTATGRFAVCDETVAAVFQQKIGPVSQEVLEITPEQISGDVLTELSAAGFIVPDDKDELSVRKRIHQRATQKTDQLWLAIAPTYACNCRCAYCYEQDKFTAKSLMSEEIIQALFAFVQQRYETTHFKSIFVEWYGGDPQLCLDVVERISGWLMGFCAEHNLDYSAMMLSNATRIQREQAELLARIGVQSMLVTIDGPKDLHNARRPAIDVPDAYESIMKAIRQLQACGIAINAVMNTDKVNMARVDELRDALAPLGIELGFAKLNDYAHTFNCPGEARFCQPAFDLYTHEEFAHAQYEQQAQQGFTREKLATLLAPFDHFCSGQMHAAYVIDAFGDVYKCDGWMGDKSRAIFNLLQGEIPDSAHKTTTFDPFACEACCSCNLLPLCWGNCSWERERCNWPCHPLVHTAPLYLASYREFFPKRTKPFQLLM